MPRSQRAKQFQPFDALKGLREAIAAKERKPEPRRELTEDAAAELNRILSGLQPGQMVTAVYYSRKNQMYTQLTGPAVRTDPLNQQLLLGENRIDFRDLYEIQLIGNGEFPG